MATAQRPGVEPQGVEGAARVLRGTRAVEVVNRVTKDVTVKSSIVGRSCRRRHLGPCDPVGFPSARGHLTRCIGVGHGDQETRSRNRLLEQGPDRQRAPGWC